MRHPGVVLLTVALLACGERGTSLTPCAGTGRALVPPAVSLAVGERASLALPNGPWDCVAAGYQRGEAVTWSVSDTGVVAIDSTGEAVGRRPGAAVVRGTLQRDPRVSATATVSVHD